MPTQVFSHVTVAKSQILSSFSSVQVANFLLVEEMLQKYRKYREGKNLIFLMGSEECASAEIL